MISYSWVVLIIYSFTIAFFCNYSFSISDLDSSFDSRMSILQNQILPHLPWFVLNGISLANITLPQFFIRRLEIWKKKIQKKSNTERISAIAFIIIHTTICFDNRVTVFLPFCGCVHWCACLECHIDVYISLKILFNIPLLVLTKVGCIFVLTLWRTAMDRVLWAYASIYHNTHNRVHFSYMSSSNSTHQQIKYSNEIWWQYTNLYGGLLTV